MENKSKSEKLFSEFPTVSTKEWEEKINVDLKGADYAKKLIWNTTEGIKVKPYYRAEDLETLEYLNTLPGKFPFVRGNKMENKWTIRQDIDEPDPHKANKIALDAISRGAEAIGFNAKEIENAEDMQILIDKINLCKVSIHFTSATSYLLIYDLFINEIQKQKIDITSVCGSFNFDSLSYYLMFGKFYVSQDNDFSDAEKLLKNVIKNLPEFKAITVNGQFIHNAGASIIQELAFSLALGNEYLANLINKNLTADDIAPKMQFVFAIGSNYFMEIAKLRAARILWSKIVEQYKPGKENSMKMNIHAVTSLWNKSVYDPYINMLRNTTETMSAAIGGCDSITVNPFDSTFKNSDEFSERNARNTQLILKYESYLDKVVDPSSGSYYIENLTDSIAEESWKLFLDIEEKGGFIKVVESGFLKEEIEKTCQKRDMDIAMRRQVILGTNQHPNLKENMLDKIRPRSNFSELGELKQYRAAKTFEALRLSTEAYEKDGHKKPSVFLFTFGNLAMRKARARFTTNFFGCIGYNIIENPCSEKIDEGMNAALQSKAEIIVFCSSDDEYGEFVPSACKQLKTKDPDLKIIVAGNPTQHIDQLKNSGVNDFIHIRTNVLETLGKYQHLMGII